MNRFGFIIHPLHPKQVAKRYPIAKYLPDPVIEFVIARKRPVLMLGKITGIRSKTGAEAEGNFIACPLTPDQMLHKLPLERVYDRLVQCAELAAEQGASLIGLGAFTSIVGDGGRTVRQRSSIGVTTGNSYTVATAIEGTLRAAQLLDIDIPNATLAVVGGTGSIGKTCAAILARQFARTILIGRDQEKAQAIAAGLPNAEVSTNVAAIRDADVVITVSSSSKELVMPEHLRAGSVVCDVARPRDVSVRVTQERPDVLVIEGGVVKVPGQVDFQLDFGFPAQTAYACMSETILLALEGNPALYDFTLGKDVSIEQVEQITALAAKHGFELAGFRAFERAVDQEAIKRARRARITSPHHPSRQAFYIGELRPTSADQTTYGYSMEGTQTLISEPPGGSLYTFTQDVEFRLASQTQTPSGTRNWYYDANEKMQYYSGPSPAGTVTIVWDGDDYVRMIS